MDTQCCGTWPEKNAIEEWLKKHGIGVHWKVAHELADSVTEYRLKAQKENESLHIRLAAVSEYLTKAEAERDALRTELTTCNQALEAAQGEIAELKDIGQRYMAHVAAMREALEAVKNGPFIMDKSWTELIDSALSTDAGTTLLDRMRKLEAVAEAARAADAWFTEWCDTLPEGPPENDVVLQARGVIEHLDETLTALDGDPDAT